MNGINEWYRKVTTDKEFAKKFADITDNKKIVSLANKEGFNFTEEELMDLKMESAAGGGFDFMAYLNKGKELFNKYGGPAMEIGKGLKGIYDAYQGNNNSRNSDNLYGMNNVNTNRTGTASALGFGNEPDREDLYS